MAVELEEIALFGLFSLHGKTIQIREEQYRKLDVLLPELEPIRVDSQKLSRLGFLRYPGGVFHRKHGNCEFVLLPTKSGQWEFSINGEQRIRRIDYIHQVQRLWFDLFEDHLHAPKKYSTKKEAVRTK